MWEPHQAETFIFDNDIDGDAVLDSIEFAKFVLPNFYEPATPPSSSFILESDKPKLGPVLASLIEQAYVNVVQRKTLVPKGVTLMDMFESLDSDRSGSLNVHQIEDVLEKEMLWNRHRDGYELIQAIF